MPKLAGILLSALLLLGCQNRDIDDHLVPAQSGLLFPAEISEKYQVVYKEAFEDSVLLRVLISNSLGSEQVIGVRSKNNRYEAFLILLEHPSKAYEVDFAEEPSFETSKLERQLSNETAIMLQRAWASELVDVRYSSRPGVQLDGVLYSYSLAAQPDHDEMAGQSSGDHRLEIDNLAEALRMYIENNMEDELHKALRYWK